MGKMGNASGGRHLEFHMDKEAVYGEHFFKMDFSFS